MHAPRKKTWKEKYSRPAYFLGALLLHILILVMIATWVIWQAKPPHEDAFEGVAVKVPTPPAPPPPQSGAAGNPALVAMPTAPPLPTITTSNTSAFTVDTSKVMSQALSHVSNLPAAQASGGGGNGGSGGGKGNAFGVANGTNIQFIGNFWDLKQTADKKPTTPEMVEATWAAMAQKFVNSGWHERDLDAYYKSTAPIYTNGFAISTRGSEEAPEAFKLDGVEPGLWLIHYKATVVPPEDGEYNFVGFGDDVLAVRIRGEVVLDAGVWPLTNDLELHKLYPYIWDASPGERRLRIGRHFHVQGGQPINIEVLIGDQGGLTAFFLLIQKVGETYETVGDVPATVAHGTSHGGNYEVVRSATPKLPYFLLNSTTQPELGGGAIPPTTSKVVTWQGAPPPPQDGDQ